VSSALDGCWLHGPLPPLLLLFLQQQVLEVQGAARCQAQEHQQQQQQCLRLQQDQGWPAVQTAA
jgi:hypothetical protein